MQTRFKQRHKILQRREGDGGGRGAQGTNSTLHFLSPASAVARVLGRVPQIVRGGRFFDKAGERVREAGRRYAANGVREPFD